MTGEISLRGLVLPIGGIKEKVLAALRAGIRTVMLPARNRRDLEDIPADAAQQLEFVWIENVDEALATALSGSRRAIAAALRPAARGQAGAPDRAPVEPGFVEGPVDRLRDAGGRTPGCGGDEQAHSSAARQRRGLDDAHVRATRLHDGPAHVQQARGGYRDGER